MQTTHRNDFAHLFIMEKDLRNTFSDFKKHSSSPEEELREKSVKSAMLAS
jgi:hypothetical protein